ncbi:MAG: uroporphyrinogen-III synthase [Kangiellaceae bacterium]
MIKKFENFVITRPLNQGDSLFKSITQQLNSTEKTNVIHLPLIQINQVEIKDNINCSALKGVIFISPNAVTHAVNQLSKKDWLELTSNPLFAVGSRTEQTLKAHVQHIAIQTPVQMNTEGLLALPDLQNVSSQNLLIVKGVGGREKLKKELLSRGAKVEELCTYERTMPTRKIVEQIESITKIKTIWIITSLQALLNFYHILKQAVPAELELITVMQNCRLIVSSDRIRASAINFGLQVIAVAKNATDEQLLDCIRELKL